MSSTASDIETEKFLNSRAEDRKRKRNKIRIANAKEKRAVIRAIKLPWKNLKKYKKMSIDAKFDFALAGYCFDNNPKVPAIEICTTTLDAPEGRRRGVRVGRALPFLPEGFITLYSEIGRSTYPHDGIQRCYQVGIKGGRYLQIHTDPAKVHGLANFINSGSVSAKPGRVLPDRDDPQNMTIAQCALYRSTTGYLSQEYRELYPAYVRAEENIPQGHELLMIYGSTHKQ